MIEINKIDIQDKTLANLPYQIDNIKIQPKSLRSIIKLGEKQFYNYLNLLLINKDDVLENISIDKNNKDYEIIKQMSNFDILILQSAQSKKFFQVLQRSFIYFLGEKEDKIGFLFNGKIKDIKKATFYIGDAKDKKLINNNNFEAIKSTLLIQNAIDKLQKKEKLKPIDSKAQKLIDLRNKMRQKVQKIKEKEGLQLRDLISIVASKNVGLNIIDIYDINMYMLQNQLQRIAVNENYEIQKFLLGNSFGGSSIDFKNNTYLKKI